MTVREALTEYMLLREAVADLEGCESACNCEEFYICELCLETRSASSRCDSFLRFWADRFAIALAKYEDVPAEVAR